MSSDQVFEYMCKYLNPTASIPSKEAIKMRITSKYYEMRGNVINELLKIKSKVNIYLI